MSTTVGGAVGGGDDVQEGVDQVVARVSPELYGLMTEEINHSYDGGIYAELIQNRAFKDDATNPVHWTLVQDGGGAGQIPGEAEYNIHGFLLRSGTRRLFWSGDGQPRKRRRQYGIRLGSCACGFNELGSLRSDAEYG